MAKKKIRVYYRAPSHVPLWKVMEGGGFLEKHGLAMEMGSLEGQRKRAAEGLKAGDLEAAQELFAAVGKVVVLEESAMDAVTGLSGSGPAYVAIAIEALADGGVKMGLDRATAMTLAAQTVLGSARLLLETGVHPGQLKDMVSSPGGTTIAGIAGLEDGGFRRALIQAVERATLRSRELGAG
jgi:pyrroline-5-carboxylate reductase